MINPIPVELHTDRLVLRPIVASDAERLAVIANDRQIAQNLTSVFPHPYSLDDAKEFIGSDPEGLAIIAKSGVGSLDPGMIGMLGHHPGDGENHDMHTFGYWLAVEAWGLGLATEAGRAYLDHFIAEAAPRRVEALVYGWNPASQRVLEKLGFTLEGRMVSRVRRFGELTDELVYGLIP